MKRFLLTMGILMGLSLALCTNAWCDSTTQQITELEKQISEMEHALSQMSSMDDKAYLRTEYKQIEQMISEAQKKLSELQAEARRKAEEIARKKAEFRNLTEQEVLELLEEIDQLKEDGSSGARYLLGEIDRIGNELGSTSTGDPVLVSSGQYIKTETDFTALIPFTRFYSTGATSSGVLGKKWSTVLDMHLEFGFNPCAQELSSYYIQLCNYLLSQKNEYERMFGQDDYTQNLEAQCAEYTKLAQEYYNLSLECDGLGIKTGIGSEYIVLIGEKGDPVRFVKTSKNTWAPEKKKSGFKGLSKSGNHFYAVCENGDKLVFLEDGSILEKHFRNGNKSVFHRDNKGLIVRIENTIGGDLVFTYNGKLLSSVTQRVSNRTISYSYENGFLSSVTDFNNNTVSFSYTSRGFISFITKPDGSKIRFDYEQVGKDGTLLATKTTNEEGFSEHFEYFPSQKKTVYTDMDGNITVYKFDNQEREIYRLDPDGHEISRTYDSDGNLSRETENGLTTNYTYDKNGHFTSISSGGITENYRWSEYGELLSFTDADGITFRWNYDEKGNPESFYQGSKLMFSASYDEKSNLVSYNDYRQKDPVTYTYIYDEDGFCKERKCSSQSKTKTEKWTYLDGQPEKYYLNGEEFAAWSYSENEEEEQLSTGLKTVFQKNNRNDLIKITKTDTLTGKSFETHITWDLRHKITAIESEGLRKEMRYTPEGRSEASITYGDTCYITWYTYKNGNPFRQTFFSIDRTCLQSNFNFQTADLSTLLQQALDEKIIEYDKKNLSGNKTEITKRLYNSENKSINETYVFNNNQNILQFTDALGQTFQNVFSPGGRLLKMPNGFGGYKEYNYDSNGLLITSEDPDYTVFEYDENGRLIKTQTEDIFRTFTYSKDGRQVTINDGGLFLQSQALDAFGNIISITDAEGNSTTFEWDSFGNLIKSTDPYGNKMHYFYDCLNHLVKQTYPDGTSRNFSWDLNNNCTKISCGDLVIWEGKYDNSGNLLWEKGMPGINKSYTYNQLGQNVQVFTGEDTTETYAYSPFNQKVTFTDGNGASFVFERDNKGRLIKETNRLGHECFYEYDDQDRLFSSTDFSGDTTTYEYKDDGKTLVTHYSDGTFNSVTKNRFGLITEIKNDYSASSFEYDTAGNLVLQKDLLTGEVVHFQYNSRGLLSKRICKNQVVDYFYDKNGRLIEMMDMQTRAKVSFTYDSMGRELTRTFGNGNTQETKYDSAGRTTLIMVKNPRGEILWAEGYIYNSNGQREITVNEKGKMSLYRYDQAGRIKEVLNSATAEMEAKLRSDAAELGLTIDENANCFENHYLCSDESGKVRQVLDQMSFGWGNMATVLQIFIRESYQYDMNGNLTKRKNGYFTQEFTYDAENRLISSRGFSPNSSNSSSSSLEKKETGLQYFYNKNGNLIIRRGVSSETVYAYNASNRLMAATVTKNDRAVQTVNTSHYLYDALGRRIFTIEDESSPKYTLYEGTSFTSIKEGSITNSNLFTELPDYVKGTDQSRYLFGDNSNQPKDYSSDLVWNLQYNSNTVALSNGVDTTYASLDILGSSRFTSNKYGAFEDIFSYDIFGYPIQGTFSPLSAKGFNGKTFSQTTGFYDFGYRDYSPSTSSFTTSDPVRDGTNWFSYCNGDPVNFFDLLGLENKAILSTYKMNVGDWTEEKIGKDRNSNNTVGKSGCAITLLANIDSTRNGNLNPHDINSPSYVTNGEIQWYVYATENELTNDRVYSYSIYDYAAQEFDNEFIYYTGICVQYCTNPDKPHWVGANGIKTIGDTVYFIISATSDNDKNVTSAEYRGYAGWKIDSDGNILVPASKVNGAIIFKEKKCKEN